VRVLVLGGTRFIGRAIVDELLDAGHEALVVHRGETEPAGLALTPHLHTDREGRAHRRGQLEKFGPEAMIDCRAMTRTDATAALAAIPRDLRQVVLSSMDVYRAFGSLLAGVETDPLPLDETSPVRTERFPYRGQVEGREEYEKLDVEEEYLRRRATVCRLPMVYGDHDYQCREEFILRRVRAGRRAIPVGPASFLWSRGYVREIARGVRLSLESEGAIGEVINLCEATTSSIGLWATQILRAAGSSAELVRAPEELLPEDLQLTKNQSQHVLIVPDKARQLLGWVHADPEQTVRTSVQWHLANSPEGASDDFSADDRALEAAERA